MTITTEERQQLANIAESSYRFERLHREDVHRQLDILARLLQKLLIHADGEGKEVMA